MVIKVIERQKIDPERFREIALMKRVCHPHVVRMLEVIESPGKLYIVYEFIDGGELFEYMNEKDYLSGTQSSVLVCFTSIKGANINVSLQRKRPESIGDSWWKL